MKHGKAGFSYYATNSWNKLTEDLRLALTLTTFNFLSLDVFFVFEQSQFNLRVVVIKII